MSKLLNKLTATLAVNNLYIKQLNKNLDSDPFNGTTLKKLETAIIRKINTLTAIQELGLREIE